MSLSAKSFARASSGSVLIGEGNTVGLRLKNEAGFFKRVGMYVFGAIVQLFRFEL